MARIKTLTFSVFLLTVGACGDNGVAPDDAPQVFLQALTLEGMLQNTLQASGFAEDDKGLDSIRVALDGVYHHTISIFGLRFPFQVSVPDVSAGAHQLQLTVFDTNGNTGTTGGNATVPDPFPVYDATIYMMRHDQIEPVPGVTFCLAESCSVTDSNGKVLFSDFDLRGSYEIGFIPGAHPHYLAVLGDNRLDRNYVNFVNGHALLGITPRDTAVSVGVNERHIIYIDSLTVPIQELIDNFNGALGHNLNFLHPTLELHINVRDTILDQAWMDSLKASTYRGLDFANARYRDLPYKDPQTYDMPYRGTMDRLSPSGEEAWGTVIVHPGTKTGMSARMEGNHEIGYRSLRLYMNVHDHVWDVMKATQYFIEMSTGATLSGLPFIAGPNYGVFMSFFGPDSTQLNRTWTVKDRQIALINIMFDTDSPLTPTGHDPVLGPSRRKAAGWTRNPGK